MFFASEEVVNCRRRSWEKLERRIYCQVHGIDYSGVRPSSGAASQDYPSVVAFPKGAGTFRLLRLGTLHFTRILDSWISEIFSGRRAKPR
jgi:hypothetical protein